MDTKTVAAELLTRARAGMPELVASFAYPVPALPSTPALMVIPRHVGYRRPDRGTSTLEWTIAIAAGNPHDEEANGRLGDYLSDPGPVLEALNGTGAAYHWCDVSEADVDVWRIGGVDYLMAVFSATTVGDGS